MVIHDVSFLVVSFLLAYAVRYAWPHWFPFDGRAAYEHSLEFLTVACLSWPFSAYLSGLYRSQRTNSLWSEIYRVFKSCLATLLSSITFTYFFSDRYSRGILLLFFLFSFILVSLGRYVTRKVLKGLRKQGYNLRHVLVVGTGDIGQRVVRTIHSHTELGLRVLGFITHDKEQVKQQRAGVDVLAAIDEMSEILKKHPVDQVIIALPVEQLAGLKQLMSILSFETVDVRVVPDFYQYATLGKGIEEFAGLPIISLQDDPLYGWNSILKRIFDLGLSVFILGLCSPLFLVIAALIKSTSSGPVFYTQERMGLDGRVFKMYKFRTMQLNASQKPSMTDPKDPRRTRVGAFLRRYSLDELPQFLNVLKGEMSIVGPRPEQSAFIEDFKLSVPKYHLRHKMKAGITGWAQIHGLRGKTSIEDRIEYDLYYIENWSLLLDVKIVFRTIGGGFLSKNAY